MDSTSTVKKQTVPHLTLLENKIPDASAKPVGVIETDVFSHSMIGIPTARIDRH
jgi:hypothetical protein